MRWFFFICDWLMWGSNECFDLQIRVFKCVEGQVEHPMSNSVENSVKWAMLFQIIQRMFPTYQLENGRAPRDGLQRPFRITGCEIYLHIEKRFIKVVCCCRLELKINHKLERNEGYIDCLATLNWIRVRKHWLCLVSVHSNTIEAHDRVAV